MLAVLALLLSCKTKDAERHQTGLGFEVILIYV